MTNWVNQFWVQYSNNSVILCIFGERKKRKDRKKDKSIKQTKKKEEEEKEQK